MPITLDGTNGITTNSGTVISASTIGVGGATPSTSGAGITFPATQSASTDANTLDDYEEGTWTPTVEGTSTAGTCTYGTRQGNYVKIGTYVYLTMFIAFSSTHTGTGGTKITGFPFTVRSSFGGGGTVTGYKVQWVTNGPDFLQAEAATTFGYLRYDLDTTIGDIAPNVNIQNNTAFMLSIWYIADA